MLDILLSLPGKVKVLRDSKLGSVIAGANISINVDDPLNPIIANTYAHPTTDGNKHVPVTSTTNDGKVLTAGATAGSFSWEPTASENLFDKAYFGGM